MTAQTLSDAERVIKFIQIYCKVPEGAKVGQPLELVDFQLKFLRDIYDNPAGTRRAIMSIARKNGKSALIACILLAHICGPMRVKNSQIVSGAQSRDQAALVFELASKMINQNPALQQVTRVIPSQKTIVGLKDNVTYKALSADGSTAHGLSPILAILDESGQVKGPNSPFIDAIMTSQGAHENPIQIFISTQAPTDADFLSVMIDDALRADDPKTVLHLYRADEDADLLDPKQWAKANPALGQFRSESDLEEQLKQASRLPSMEASSRNLLLNQRVSLERLAFAPKIVGENNGPSDWEAFRQNTCHMGLDLSRINDLTAAVLACDDGDKIHIKTFAFTPLGGIRERSQRDRVPYDQWADQEVIYAPPGDTLDYTMICEYLQMALQDQGVEVATIQFDRWRIEQFKAAAEPTGFGGMAEWQEVGQGYQSFSPRLEALETGLLQRRLLMDNHPVLNMGMANALAMSDPAGNKKLVKPKENGPKIDAAVALVMAVYPILAKQDTLGGDISHWIG